MRSGFLETPNGNLINYPFSSFFPIETGYSLDGYSFMKPTLPALQQPVQFSWVSPACELASPLDFRSLTTMANYEISNDWPIFPEFKNDNLLGSLPGTVLEQMVETPLNSDLLAQMQRYSPMSSSPSETEENNQMFHFNFSSPPIIDPGSLNLFCTDQQLEPPQLTPSNLVTSIENNISLATMNLEMPPFSSTPPTCHIGHLPSKLISPKKSLSKSKNKPFKCEECGRTFKRHTNLTIHRRLHTDLAPTCKYCGKKFARTSNCKEHERVHTGERPFKCKVCGHGFKQKHSLKEHLRLHSGEKPYKCSVCGWRFTVKHNLTTHMRTHTGEKPYMCKLCYRRFGQKSILNCHLTNIHGLSKTKRV